MTPEIACPTIQQIHYPLRHHPTNTKQAKYHTPHLISYRTVKEEMIYRFPRTTNCLFRRLSIVRILPKVAVQEKIYLRLPHHFPRERNASRSENRMIIPIHLETSTTDWLTTKIVRTNTPHLSGIDQNHKRIQRLRLLIIH